jgi:putative ABC transport system permease protein
MRTVRAFVVRIAGWMSGRRFERDLADELESHLEMHAADNRRAGMPPAEARRAALIKLGGLEPTKEVIREVATLAWVGTVGRDVRYALRGLRRAPTFTSAAVISMTLGLGSGIAVFTVADSLLLRPLPYRDPEQLVMVWETKRHGPSPSDTGLGLNAVSPGNYFAWKAKAGVFESLAGFRERRSVLAAGGRVEELRKQLVTADLLPMLGVQPIRGRLFTAGDDRPGVDGPLIISHRVWQEWFAGDSAIIGRAVQVNATPRTIVGVMPPGFYFRDRTVDLWEPLGLNPARDYRATEGRSMLCLARLKPGVTMDSAQARMTALAGQLEIEHPAFNSNMTVTIESLHDAMFGNIKRSLMLLLGAVGLLLAVACANVAGLQLARLTARRRELAVRASLGAGRWRVVRLLLAEGLVLGLIAGVAGLVLARWLVASLLALAPTALVRGADVRVDWRIVVFGLTLSLVTAVFFGLAPALITTGPRLVNPLRDDTRTMSGPRATARTWLVSAEVASTVVLLVGAVLLFRTLAGLSAVPSGIERSNLLTFRVSIPAARYPEDSRRTQFFARAVEAIEQLPGVRVASAVSWLPFAGSSAAADVIIEGRPAARRGEEMAVIRTVMPGYFQAMGIGLRSGREFLAADNAPGAPLHFIVSESFARRFFADASAVGKRVSVAMNPKNPYGEIVGIVGDVREGALDKGSLPTVYYVYQHLTYTSMTLVVRTEQDPSSIVEAVRRVIGELDPAQPIADVWTMEEVVGETVARQRFSAVLLSAFSVLSLLLACVGIYGVLAYAVSQRRREIGVRLALGAGPGRIVWLIAGSAARMVVAGLVAGIAGALAVTRLIESLLFGIGPRDVTTFVFVTFVLATTGLGAAALPAFRASRVDPTLALRGD